jgi:alanine racemase
MNQSASLAMNSALSFQTANCTMHAVRVGTHIYGESLLLTGLDDRGSDSRKAVKSFNDSVTTLQATKHQVFMFI